MKSKTKIISSIILAVFTLTAIIASIALVAVFASRTQKVNSNIKINYKALGVTGNVSAKYYVGNEDKSGTDMTTTGLPDGEKVLTFEAGDSELNSVLNPQGNIELTEDKLFVVFEYKFVNLGTEFEANLLFQGTAPNVEVTSAEANEPISDFSTITTAVETPSDFEYYSFLNKSETTYVYLKINVVDIYNNANFNGTFLWDLELDPSPTLDKTFKFTEAEDHVTLTGLQDGFDSAELDIPAHYKGKLVTTISGGLNNAKNLTSIYVPTTITSISALATNINNFYYKGSLKKWCETEISSRSSFMKDSLNVYYKTVDGYNLMAGDLIIPDSVTKIASYAFYYRPITSLTIGEGVKSIGDESFGQCQYCTKVNFNAVSCADISSSYDSFINIGVLTSGVTVEFGNNVQRIPSGFFSGNLASPDWNKVTSIIVGEKVSSINVTAGVFNYQPISSIKVSTKNEFFTSQNASGVECNMVINKLDKTLVLGSDNNTIPDDGSVLKIGAYSFTGRENLTELTLPAQIIEIGTSAFRDCTALEKINYNCVNLTGSIYASDSNPFGLRNDNRENSYPYYRAKEVDVVFGSGVKTIPTNLFYGANTTGWRSRSIKVKSVTMADSVETIGDRAFYYCEYLVSATIGAEVKTIGKEAFYNCGLTKIIIGSGVTSMGSAVFYNCSVINDITIESETVCKHLLNDWYSSTYFSPKTGAIIKAKYEIVNAEARGYTKSEEQQDGYWVYTKN